MEELNEIIKICKSVFEGNQSMDESIIYAIHELALEIKAKGEK
ncbi:hypothetical protein ACLVL5_06230 [Streptococcus pneumoniae]